MRRLTSLPCFFTSSFTTFTSIRLPSCAYPPKEVHSSRPVTYSIRFISTSSFCLLDYINKGDGGFRHSQIILVSLAFPFATAWAVVAVVVRTHVAQAQACLEAPVLAQHP